MWPRIAEYISALTCFLFSFLAVAMIAKAIPGKANILITNLPTIIAPPPSCSINLMKSPPGFAKSTTAFQIWCKPIGINNLSVATWTPPWIKFGVALIML